MRTRPCVISIQNEDICIHITQTYKRNYTRRNNIEPEIKTKATPHDILPAPNLSNIENHWDHSLKGKTKTQPGAATITQRPETRTDSIESAT